MNSHNSKHRVLGVFLLFVPIALFAMWIIGGKEQTFVVTVKSSLSGPELTQRFESLVSQLELLKEDQLDMRVLDLQSRKRSSAQNSVPFTLTYRSPAGVAEQGPGAWPHADATGFSSNQMPLGEKRFPVLGVANVPTSGLAMLGSDVLRSASGFHFSRSLPLADIVYNDIQDESDLLIDPTIVFCDPEFETSISIDRHWVGQDISSIYLQEFDSQHNVRVVRLIRENFQIADNGKQDEIGSTVTYRFSIRHHGLRRIYGKFFERDCEGCVINRLQWICEQLENEIQ